ncbi:MAG TPA: histidine-type phosphatase [Opitutaceae bacterium]|jgi:4-phytase/acid phosphatase
MNLGAFSARGGALYLGAALELVVILGRHGVRSPLQSPELLGEYSADAWPKWPVAPGYLTAHGSAEERALGVFFHDRYVADGLLSGQAPVDAPAITLRSDNDQRTVESARMLGEALAPNEDLRLIHPPAGQIDPLFGIALDPSIHADKQYLAAAVLGRMGNDPHAIIRSHQAAYENLERILFPQGPVPANKLDLLKLDVAVLPGEGPSVVSISGAFGNGIRLTDALELEYCEGLPMDQVGWGRLNLSELQQLMVLHSLYFDFTEKTYPCAQVKASNLARHLIETFDQAVQRSAVPGAIGPANQKVLVLLGHDTNLINLAGLLNIDWILPGSELDCVLPGGSLVMELRRDDQGKQWVRIEYVSETMQQLHDGTRVSLANPPGIAPIFIPSCSTNTPGYDAPLEAVEAKLNAAIDPRYVRP